MARFSGVAMPYSFEQSPLWRRTLAECPADRDCAPRQSLREEDVVFLTLDGRQLSPPDDALFVGINPPWLFPEEVLERPRDERFTHAVQSESTWNLDAWWYDTGNFGNVGLVVRTIAETWQISIEDAIRLMEPLHVQGDRDLRLCIETDEGEPLRVTAIRMRRPAASR